MQSPTTKKNKITGQPNGHLRPHIKIVFKKFHKYLRHQGGLQMQVLNQSRLQSRCVRIALVPIICRCTVPVDPNRNKRFTTAVTVTVNGMIIGDAEVYPQNYTPDTSAIELDLLCTVPIFTKIGLVDAIKQAKRSKIEISGLGMKGSARVVSILIGSIVTMIDPITGKCTALHGADR